MKTLHREPWRGGQICGEQLEYGVVPGRLVFCGELKKPDSYACDVHDKALREETLDGSLPKFAPGNAKGLAEYRRRTMPYMFELRWEPEKGRVPIMPTPEELAAFEAQS